MRLKTKIIEKQIRCRIYHPDIKIHRDTQSETFQL